MPPQPSGWDGLGPAGRSQGEAADAIWVQGMLKAREPGAAAALPHPLLCLPSPGPASPPPPPFEQRDKPKLPAEPLRSASWRSRRNPQLHTTCWTSALLQAYGKSLHTRLHTPARAHTLPKLRVRMQIIPRTRTSSHTC